MMSEVSPVPIKLPLDFESTSAQLQRLVLLGTERMQALLPQGALPSGALRGSESDSSWALQWISQSTAIRYAAGQSAKQLSAATVPPFIAQEHSESTVCFMGPAAQAALRACLDFGGNGELLVCDLFNTLQALDKTIAPLVLPITLKFLTKLSPSLREQFDLRKLLGPRGMWLAGQNSEWAMLCKFSKAHDFSDVENLHAQWDVATLSERVELVKTLRAQPDMLTAQPDLVTGLINNARATEAPIDVAKYIAALAPQLSSLDHDWLEEILDAKHKPLRSAAVDLLSRLPSSALVARALHYLMQGLFHCEVLQSRSVLGLVKGKPALNFVLPDVDKALEKALARDGYLIKATTHTTVDRKAIDIGPKLSLLLQCLENVPFDAFCAALNISTEDGLLMLLAHESCEALVAAVGRSTLRYQVDNQSLINNLLNSQLLPREIAIPLARKLSAQARENYILSGKSNYSIADLIEACNMQEAFSPRLSEWVLKSFDNFKLDSYNRCWNHGDEAALAIRLDIEAAQRFVMSTRAVKPQRQDAAKDQMAPFAANYWEPLLRALELKIAYTEALKN
jgi:Family of unknown function (DUF5691)